MLSAVVLDIEGTICPITFVKNVLYPYFTERFPAIVNGLEFPLDSTSSDPIVSLLVQLPPEIIVSPTSIIEYFADLVAKDIKHPVLKGLQGYIWKLGYENGEVVAPIYPDSVDFIRNCPIPIYIYSSGSIKAQKLLFQYVGDKGNKTIDLNPKLSGYFDITTAGYKNLPGSYTKIVQEIGKSPNSVLFLSDNVNEVNAALQAGLQSSVVIREGNAPLSEQDLQKFTTIRSLDQVKPWLRVDYLY